LKGVGFGRSQEALGDFPAHSLLLTVLIEIGLLGLIMFVAFMVAILKFAGKPAFRVFLPYMVAGMSFASLSAPFFPISLLALGVLQKTFNREYERKINIGTDSGIQRREVY
jgi:hypothetical protein